MSTIYQTSSYRTFPHAHADRSRAFLPLSPTLKYKPSPFQQLPTELLFDIFEFLPRSPISIHSIPDVWTCAQVCRHWRELLCKGMPWLWSSFEVDVDASPSDDALMLRTFLARSGDRPLSISLKRSIRIALSSGDYSANSRLRRLLDLLMPYSPRWERFACHGLFIHELELFAPVKGRISTLMDLSLYVHDDNAYDHDSQNVAAVVSDTFLSAPRLRSASVLGTRLECSPLQLPWNQLVSYHSNHGYRQLADVLQMAIGMQECVISSGSKIHDVHDGPFVHHERLRTLSVPNVDVLNYLSLPSLERLTVSLRSALELSPLAAFLDAASRVRELNLIGHFAPSDRCDVRNRLKQLLHSTPFLSGLELGLSSSQATNALFSLLTESEDLLPELRFLTVHFPSFGMEDEVRALAMVASRSRNGAFAFKMRLSTRLVRDWRSLERLREFGRRNSVVECVE